MQEPYGKHEKIHSIIKEIIKLKTEGFGRNAERSYSKTSELSASIVDILSDVEGKNPATLDIAA